MANRIVVLPGVLASRLYFPNSDRYWDPDGVLRMLWWVVTSGATMAQAIHRDEPAVLLEDESDELEPDEFPFGWAALASEYYLPFLRHLRAEFGDPVHAMGYDWRQDITALGADIAARLQALIQPEDRVVLVTHSMGGLVARSALQQVPALQAKIHGVVHVCQPVHGAVVLYRRFFTGMLLGVDGGLFDLPLIWILGDDPLDFTRNMCGLPGPMQLLPAPGYRSQGNHWNPFQQDQQVLHDLYELADRPPGLALGDLSEFRQQELIARLAEVRAFHGALGNFRHPATWAIHGAGLPTDVSLTLTDDVMSHNRTDEGDGTVPIGSAAGLFPDEPELDGAVDPLASRRWLVTDVEHARAMVAPSIQKAVVAILKHLLPE